ncbi:MAG: LytR C-terminal domain-containing protein [Patescibacteria group bacterium]
MKLAGLFILLVLGLMIFSLFLKLAFLIKESKFDGAHKFNIELMAKDKVSVVSFSPSNKSLTILLIKEEVNKDNLSKSLGIPIDGKIVSEDNLSKNNLSFILLKSVFPLRNLVKDINIVDLIRLSMFLRTVSEASVYERELSDKFNDVQKSTIISLSFTDPTIYEENQTIEVINAAKVYGIGGRLANLISHMGGNVVFVSSGDKTEKISKIIYSGNLTYTVKKLSSYLNFVLEKKDKKSIADVIIIIGTDRVGSSKF